MLCWYGSSSTLPLLRWPVFDLLLLSHIIKWLVLVWLFKFAGIGISGFGLCAVDCGGDSDSRSGYGFSFGGN